MLTNITGAYQTSRECKRTMFKSLKITKKLLKNQEAQFKLYLNLSNQIIWTKLFSRSKSSFNYCSTNIEQNINKKKKLEINVQLYLNLVEHMGVWIKEKPHF